MKYIERGWQSYLDIVVSKKAGDVQILETRQAFFAGAAVLFTSIMLGLEGGEELTDKDMQRMDDIETEIDQIGQQIDDKYLKDYKRKMI